MAFLNKSDLDAVRKLQNKVNKDKKEEKQKQATSNQTLTTTPTNDKATSRATYSPAPSFSNKTDPTMLRRLEKKVSQEKTKTLSGNTTKKSTDFNAETKNAYTNAKNKLNDKTTITSNMTEEERKARIKEINAELSTLDKKLSGYSRASAYGTSKAMAEAKKKDEARIAELSEELKSLERAGTFSASELKQFEIEDAKAKLSSARQKVQSYGQRPSLESVESYRQAVSEQYNAQQELDELERQQELYDDISKFGDVVNEDTFTGQWRANYRSNELNREADKAISRYIDNPTEENKEIAYAYDAFAKEYAKNNEKALDDENVKASWLTKSMAGYLPQLKDQVLPEVIGGGVGFILGSAVGAPTVGMSVGAGIGTGAQSYNVMRGSVYRTLLAEGVDEETALQAANDEALISALIEGGETALSVLLAGGSKAISAISGAAKTSVAKGSTNAATKFIANLATKSATKATTKAATKAAAEVSKPLWRKGLGVAFDIAKQGASEYGEEFLQGAVSRANKERALSGSADGKGQLIKESYGVFKDAVTGKDPEAFAELHEQGAEGFKISVMFGGSQATVNNIVSHYANAKTVKLQNEIADTIIEDEESLNALIEDGKASGEGTVSAKIAEEVERAREKGEVTREQVKKLIASNEVYIREEEKATTTSDTLERAAMDVVNERNRKSTPSYERLEALSQNNEPVSVEDVKKATGFGDEGAKLVSRLANREGVTFSQAERTVKTAYMAGFTDLKTKDVSFDNALQKAAFDAGKLDIEVQNRAKLAEAKNATVYDGAFTENKYTKNWSDATKKMVSTVAKHFGMDIKAVDKIIANKYTGAEANASHADGEMRISSTAEKLIHALVLHESGHRMEQFATAEWNELANFLYQRAERLGRRVELGITQGMEFDAVKSEHDNAGISMSTKGYIGEIAVRELETIFSSAEEFNSFIAEIDSNQQVKSAWGKFVEWLSELIEDLKTAWSQRKMTAEEKAEARKAIAELEHIKELYAKAYLATKDAVAERAKEQTSETNSAKNLEIKTNKEYNGNKSYSLQDSADANLATIKRLILAIRGRRGLKYDGGRVIRIPDNDMATLRHKFMTEHHYSNRSGGSIDCIDCFGQGGKKHYFYVFLVGEDNRVAPIFRLDYEYIERYLDDVQKISKEMGYNKDEFINTASGNGKGIDRIRNLAKGDSVYDVSATGRETNHRSGEVYNSESGRGSTDNGHSSSGISNGYDKQSNYGSLSSVLYEGQPQFSLKDSEGNTLTEAQQEFFKDSKVRDENGNLLVMYQGASEDFTVFDRKKSSYANLYGRGFYFTKNENHARQYGNTRAYYLNIKHPVSTTETAITKSQLRKFLQAVIENEDYSFENYGYGATIDSVLESVYGKSDFLMLNDVSQTAIGDLVEAVELFNEVNNTDYDGIMLDTETVTFNSEQAKLTSNEKPTSNPDTRFSLKQPVEETKNLVAVHNMQASELERTLDLGGLPMPSIAIIKAQSGHSEYGDVSLVFDKSVIDPKANKNNKVYGGDAWTPTYPKIEYKPNDKLAKKISDKYYELSRTFGYDETKPLYSYVYDLEEQLNRNKGEAGMIEELYGDTRLMQVYLLDSGKGKVDTINKETRTELTDAEVKMCDFFIKELGADVVDEVKWDGNSSPIAYRKNYMSKYEDAIREAYKKLLSEEYQFTEEQVQNVLGSTKTVNYLNFVRDAQKYRENGRVTIKTEADYEATEKAIRETAGEDYRKWVDSLFKGVEEKSGIRNNVDYFTNGGNRRSWEALHWENNLENVIKVMKSQDDVGSVGFFSGQNIWGVAAKDYRSIEEIKADSDRLQQIPEEEYNKIKEGYGQRLSEIAHSIMDKSERNPFIASDNAMECIVDAVRNSKTKSGILNNLKQYQQLTVTQTTVDDIVSLVNDISNMPTEYFEAKPKRAVELNEIATAIIPDNTSQTTKARLDDLGIKYVEYEAGNEEARLEALNSLEDVKFSLKRTNDISSKDRAELLDIIEHLKGEFEITKFAKADQKKLAKMTKALLKEYSSQADFDETLKAVDELYQYMANGEDGHPAVWEEVYNRAYNVAREIAKNALVTDDYMYQEYKSLRDYLRTTPMKFNAQYDSVPASYENFNDFRKQNMGRLKFTKDGMGIDEVYQELSGLYPEFFDAEEQINSSDQLAAIVDALDSIRATEVNPFDGQIEQVSMQLANDLASRFFDIPQAKPTFADKAERRVTEAHIKGGKRVEAVRQQKDAKIQKLMEAQKEKTKKQLDKLREQRDAKVKKEQEKRRAALSKMSESQKAKVLRANIIRETGELNKTLLKATDKKHIPPELENAVVALLYNINMESNYSYDVESHSYKKNDKGLPTNKTKAFQELKAVYEQIAEVNDYGLTLAPELFGSKSNGISNIFDDVMKLSDKKIADMTSEELTKIYDAIRLVEHSIATANKMFAMQKWESLTQTAKAFEKSVATRRAKNPLRANYTIDIETPITFFSHFGEAGQELYEALREAQDNGQTMIDEISEIVGGIVSLEEVQKADKEFYEFTTVEGKKLTLSKAHIMDIYLLYNRKQGKKHLLFDPDGDYFGRGIRQPEIKSKKIGRGTENIQLSKPDIGNIISKLSKQDKAIADKMQKVTLKLAEWGNKASKEVFGYEKFNDPDYWTIKSAPEGTNKSVEKNKNIERSIKNMGSAKTIDDKATNALEIGGIFDVFNQHASDMICYSSWLAVVEDATKLYNYTLRDELGNKTSVTFQDLLNKYAGKGGSDYYFNLLSDIQNGIGTKPDTRIERIYTSLYGKAAKAKVAYKATVVAQQPMAIVRAASVLNPLSIMQAVGKGGVNLPAWAVGKVKNLVTKDAKASGWYGGWQRALKYAPIAARKAVGGYEINSNSSGLESVLYKPKTTKGKTIDALKESPLWAAGKADEITWGVLWNACEIETSKNKTLEKGSDAYYKAVAKLFNKVINETQVVDGVLQRSQIMRSSSGWIKPATAFKGEPIMGLNTIIRAYDNLRYETNPAKRGKSIKSFSRVVTVFVANAIFTAFARSLAVGWTGDDDEDYWKKVWKSFSGVNGDEETWFEYVKNIGLKSDVANNINPLSWLPITSEMMSALQGYDVERLDVASIGEFVNAATMFINSLDEESKHTPAYATRNLLLKFSELTGYSPYNLVRDIEGAIRTARVETNDVKGLYDMEKWRTKPASNTSKYVDILYMAYSTDSEDYEYIYNDMIENGIDAEKIENGMEDRMKEAEGVEKASELSKRYMSPTDEKKYDSSLKRVKSSDAWKSANATQRKEAEADLYDFLTSTSEAMEKTRAEARAFGVDETEYTLWQLAREMVNDDKDSMNAKEKAAAIEMLDLGNSELAYFYNTETADKAFAGGVDIENFAMFKAAVSGLKGDDKKAKVNAYANQYAGDYKEYLFFMGTEYSSYKKRSDYKEYFGE